eukprot:NODE_71_length_24927_cov_1.205937.p5 type:complete len:443 gc:universal NODE_71_length_24927_cov_1.205937:17858-16530(-)
MSSLSPTIDALTDLQQHKNRRFSSQSDLNSPNEIQTKSGIDVIDLELLRLEFELQELDMNQIFTCCLENTTNTGRLIVNKSILGYIGQDAANVVKIKIYLHDIVNIEKRNTASVFPNAIRIYTTQNFYTFVSFLKRNAAHKLMQLYWEDSCKEYAALIGESTLKIPNMSNSQEEIVFPKSSVTNALKNSEEDDIGSTLQEKLLGEQESISRIASADIDLSKSPTIQSANTPMKIKEALEDVIDIKSASEDKKDNQAALQLNPNDPVKAFWSNMGKSLATIQAQITEKTKPRQKSSISISKTMDSLNVIAEDIGKNSPSPKPYVPGSPDVDKLLKPLLSVPSMSNLPIGSQFKMIVFEKLIKLKPKYIYRFLFESPLLQRTLQSQGAIDLEITHWSEVLYKDTISGTQSKCNSRTIAYKVNRPTELFKFSDIHYLVNSVENEK